LVNKNAYLIERKGFSYGRLLKALTLNHPLVFRMHRYSLVLDFFVTEAVDNMVIDHTDSLHMRINDR